MSGAPSAADVRAFYDRVAPGYAEVLPDTSFEAPLDLGMLDHFVSLLPPDAAVLDAGCGTGRMIAALQQRGVQEVVGVDLAPGMIAVAQQAHPDRRLLVGDLHALPCDDAAFDGVLAWYSIIHTAPDRLPDVLLELARVLRPGGLLLLGFQAGTGTRAASGAPYRGGGTVGAVLHPITDVRDAVTGTGMTVIASAERVGRRHAQGFVIGALPASP